MERVILRGDVARPAGHMDDPALPLGAHGGQHRLAGEEGGEVASICPAKPARMKPSKGLRQRHSVLLSRTSARPKRSRAAAAIASAAPGTPRSTIAVAAAE
jgi:Mrp family chromosome partitioning ATPase